MSVFAPPVRFRLAGEPQRITIAPTKYERYRLGRQTRVVEVPVGGNEHQWAIARGLFQYKKWRFVYREELPGAKKLWGQGLEFSLDDVEELAA